MNYFKSLENILFLSSPSEKFSQFDVFYEKYNNNELNFENEYDLKELEKPSYESFLNIISSKDMKIRKRFDTIEGKAYLLHTIAHIEYSAIDLALDAALRFQNLPRDYYDDWLEVASDEIRHFKMIEKALNNIGYKYGDFDVHTNLFDAMKNTTTLIERMAIVPRYLEANGLDQNPKIMNKLNSSLDEINKEILKILQIILNEEVEHVHKGDRWYKYACKKEGVDPESTYIKLLEKYYPGSTSRKLDMNFEARKKAGFSCDELKRLSNKNDCN